MKKIVLLLLGILVLSMFSGCIGEEKEKKDQEYLDLDKLYIIDEDSNLIGVTKSLSIGAIMDSSCWYTKLEYETYLLLTYHLYKSTRMGVIPYYSPLYNEKVSTIHKWVVQKKQEGKLIVTGWCDPLRQNEVQNITYEDLFNKAEERGEIHFNLNIDDNKEEETIYYKLSYIVPSEIYWEYIIEVKIYYGSWTVNPYYFLYDTNNTNSIGDSE